MLEELPPKVVALKILLADLHGDLAGRVARLRTLMALEFDFGQGRGLLLPGGSPAHVAYVETRLAFVAGNFLSVILLSQCLLENVFAAQLNLDKVSIEARTGKNLPRKLKPPFTDTISGCRSARHLNETEACDLLRLSKLRNALIHFRDVNDPDYLDRRAFAELRPSAEVCERDARFAMNVFVRILAKPIFRFKMDTGDRD